MIVLYTLILIVLGVVNFLVARRVKSLEKKFSRVSLATSKLANLPPRGGNSGNRGDVCQAAKQQFELGRLVQQRDRLEGSYYRWKGVSERLTRWAKSAREWKGRKLPYTLGVVDVSTLMYVVDRFGLASIDLSGVVEMARTALQR